VYEVLFLRKEDKRGPIWIDGEPYCSQKCTDMGSDENDEIEDEEEDEEKW